MKTIIITKSDIDQKWYLIDAKDQILGRLASRVASILLGKNKPAYTPNMDNGDNIVLVNSDKVKLSGNKAEQKTYFSHSTYPGGSKTLTLQQIMAKDPTFVVKHAVKGMLPKNSRGRQMFKKLFVYSDEAHPHQAQQPQVLSV